MKFSYATVRDNRRKWVEALRSRNYVQGKGRLHHRKDNSFCCFGVGANICPVTKYNYREDTFDSNYAYPPHSFTQWVGLRSPAGTYMSDREYKSLMTDNDCGAPFSKIADIIESEPEGLFLSKEEIDAEFVATHRPPTKKVCRLIVKKGK